MKFVALYQTRIGDLTPLFKHLGLAPTQEQLQRQSSAEIDELPWFNPAARQTLQESLQNLKEWKDWKKLPNFDEKKLTVNWEVIERKQKLNPTIDLPSFVDLEAMPSEDKLFSFSDLSKSDLWPQGAMSKTELSKYSDAKMTHEPISHEFWNISDTNTKPLPQSQSRTKTTGRTRQTCRKVSASQSSRGSNNTDLTNSGDDRNE